MPSALAVLVVFLVRDPTYRLPLLALVLPLFAGGAAGGLGLHDRGRRPSVAVQLFTAIGFAAFVVGWLVTFGVVGFMVTVGVFAAEPSADLLKVIMLFAALGLVFAAWFLWPWYARNVLPNWPRHELRIWTSSGNRWDRVLMAWRQQRMSQSGAVYARGFVATALVLACVVGTAAAGVYDGPVARVVEIGCLVPLPFLHVVIVREAHALCDLWADAASGGTP